MVKILKKGASDKPVALRCSVCDCLYELEGDDLFAESSGGILSICGPAGQTQTVAIRCPMENCDNVMEFTLADWFSLRENGGMADVREELDTAEKEQDAPAPDVPPADPTVLTQRPLLKEAMTSLESVLQKNEWRGSGDGALADVLARLIYNIDVMNEAWGEGIYNTEDTIAFSYAVLDVMALSIILYGKLEGLSSVNDGATMTREDAEAKRAEPPTTILGEDPTP